MSDPDEAGAASTPDAAPNGATNAPDTGAGGMSRITAAHAVHVLRDKAWQGAAAVVVILTAMVSAVLALQGDSSETVTADTTTPTTSTISTTTTAKETTTVSAPTSTAPTTTSSPPSPPSSKATVTPTTEPPDGLIEIEFSELAGETVIELLDESRFVLFIDESDPSAWVLVIQDANGFRCNIDVMGLGQHEFWLEYPESSGTWYNIKASGAGEDVELPIVNAQKGPEGPPQSLEPFEYEFTPPCFYQGP